MKVEFSGVPKKIKAGEPVPIALAVKNDTDEKFKVKAKFFAKMLKGRWSLYLGSAEFDVKPKSDEVYQTDLKFNMPSKSIQIFADVIIIDKKGSETKKRISRRVYVSH